MNTRSQISLTNTSLRDLQLPPKQRQTNTTKSSSSSNTSSSPMNSKNNSDNDPSDDTNLHKQLELKSSAVIEEQTETDNSLYSNQPIQEQKETFQNNVDQVHNLNDNHSNDSDEKPSLRDFLRCYITIFSGNENALQWFTQTDLKFSELNLSFNDRLEILPNFLTGCALLWFSSNRDKIKCYMDFCQLFNVEYVNSKPTPESHISSQCSNRHSLINSQVINNKDFIDKPTDHSGNITTPLTHHHIPSTDSNNSTLSHPTSSTISKALIDKFVKDPIKFYGGKDSVINWLDEIEQQFHNMQLCESDKLNLIQICLKGDAQQCYRQNKKYFTSWSQFVTEIKKSYHSNLQRDIAFKKLQQYHQTPHQSVF
ncbi:unnamed protein product [Rotaria sp. Silwood1]|nr:unnamed protein product [Rotaria sp. Silwood1]